MHDLAYDAASERLYRQLLFRRKRSQAAAYAVNLRLANGFQVVLQRNDGGHDVQRLQARLEALHLGHDDGLGALGFLPAIGDVRRNRLLQIVDVVNEDAVQLVHRRDRRHAAPRYR